MGLLATLGRCWSLRVYATASDESVFCTIIHSVTIRDTLHAAGRYRIGNSHKAQYSAERCHKVQQNWMPVCSCVVRLAVIAEANTLQSRMQVKGTAISATMHGSTEYCCSCTWEVRGGSTKQSIQQSSTLLRVQVKGTTTYSSTRYSFARGCSR